METEPNRKGQQNAKVGAYGEWIAGQYLLKQGYGLLAKNFRIGHLEIDLVAKKEGRVIFFEVKTLLTSNDSSDAQPLSRQKIARLKQALSVYVERSEIDPETVEIGYLEVMIDTRKKVANIRKYLNIF
jgi:putative endonuclease